MNLQVDLKILPLSHISVTSTLRHPTPNKYNIDKMCTH